MLVCDELSISLPFSLWFEVLPVEKFVPFLCAIALVRLIDNVAGS